MNNTTYARLTELREAYIKADQKAEDAAKVEYEFWTNHLNDPQWARDGRSTWHGLVDEANDLREASRIAREAYDAYFDAIRCDNVDIDDDHDIDESTGDETDAAIMACFVSLDEAVRVRDDARRSALRDVKTRLEHWCEALGTNFKRAEYEGHDRQAEALNATIDHYQMVIRRIIDPMLADNGEEES